MNILTAYLGEVEIESSQILHFEHGIPGFEDEKGFVLLPIEDNTTFHVLQSIKTAELAFIVTNPFDITTNYSFEIDEVIAHSLQINDPREVAVLSIVSLKESIKQSTINLKAPIVWNTTNNKAKQVILNNEDYAIRHLISTESVEG
ncbi:flagellar assembly protein FliW [Rummeliibacillus stabekisii]|uniref:flagellar assembly protein FliW n=1 Tax=Rummeliibacillus stabekisii TaxID=241244 RepID=UPI00117231A2|nr:flagellar assembly protein FliW [Rummeliibacillus stabekisii]MBB5170207.1 flagellar assembly factor FliW [Rummeliibacillus stabekisii]GEL04466.1 flagellar assembly factor FliW [Rummeliibacillus stabekisii]